MTDRGFTLIELLVALAILSILTAIAVPSTGPWRQRAQHKQAAREVVSVLRRARSVAVQQNQNTTVTFDLTNRTYSLGAEGGTLPQNIEIEGKEKFEDAWKRTGTLVITFRPQGTANETIFVRINEDDDLQVRVNSAATGLAHM